MKVRLYFEPLTIEIPNGDIPIGVENGEIDSEELLTYIEENWDKLVDPTEPVVGAIKPLALTPDDNRLERFTAHVDDIEILEKSDAEDR